MESKNSVLTNRDLFSHEYMITDRIGRHEVLLPINHNLNKICDKKSKHKKFQDFFFLAVKKRSHLRARVLARTVQLLTRHNAYCPTELSEI